MDANALLAIYTKVQQIYNSEGSKFLSFPLDFQFTFSPESLNLFFGKDAATAVSSLNQKADFSRVMNLPVKSLFPSSDAEGLLWDVYQEILTTAEIADNAMTEAEKEAFRKAEEFLFVKDEEGRTVPSERYRQYSEFRDRDFILEEQILNLQLSETVAENEQKRELAKLQKEKAENEALWSAGGLRQETEKHLEFRQKVLSSSPLMAWARMKEKCQADLSVQSDLTGGTFATTVLFPSDVLSQEWCSIQVGEEEVAALLEQASPDIRKRLTSAYTDPILSFSFDYRSVGVQRPWFDSDLFKSRMWRLPVTSNRMISYGSDRLLGRFPAYISALLLLRNFQITYASGKTVHSFGSLASNQEGSDKDVSILAYICKRLPLSPNPAEDVEWPTVRKTARLQLQQKAGGLLRAFVGGEEVDSGLFNVGEKVRIVAVADADSILSQWKVNEATVENVDYTYEAILDENGLTVAPCWEPGDKLDPGHFQVRKDRLVSVDKGPSVLDMNRFHDLCQVKVIGEKAFGNYANLTNVTIGKAVEIIGEQVFPNCTNLENVSIPATTQSVHERAFIRNGFQEEPFVKVAPAHAQYTQLDGVLLDKKEVQTVKVAFCPCGARFIFSDEAPAVCPRCGAPLDTSKAPEIPIRRPDARIPFRVTEKEARELVRARYAQERSAEKAFRTLAAQDPMPLHPVYVPLWEWRIHAERSQPDDTPAPAVRDSVVAVTSSLVVGDEVIDTNDRYTEGFSFGHTPAGTAFELYPQSSRRCQKSKREMILDAVRQKEGPSPDGSPAEEVNYLSEGNRLLFHPFWVGSLEYKGETHPFCVDGYSRKVTLRKDVPKDNKKRWIILGSILAGLALAALAVFLVMNLLSNRADTRAPAVKDRALTVSDPAGDGFTLAWNKAKDNATPADSIRYQVFLKGGEEAYWRLIHEGLGITSYRFSGLAPETRYAFYVTAGDKAGNSFRYLDGETTVEDLDPPVIGNQAFQVLPFEKSLVFCWEKAHDNVTPEDKIGYQVLLKEPGASEWRTGEVILGRTFFQFTDLTPDTDYSCTIRAKDGKGLVAGYGTLTTRTSAAATSGSTPFVVVLIDAGPASDQVAKVIQKQTKRGVNAAQTLMDEAPVIIKTNLSQTQAAALQEALTQAGATVEVVNRR